MSSYRTRGSSNLAMAGLLTAVGLLIAGCSGSDDPPPLTMTGKELYEEYCEKCHKASGLGRFVMGIPNTFAHGLSKKEVVKLIREGDPRFADMPTFPQIQFSQAYKIAAHIEELKNQK